MPSAARISSVFVRRQRPDERRGLVGIRTERLYGGFSRFADLDSVVYCRGRHGGLRWTLTGTHQGQFQGIPATGRPIKFNGLEFNKVADGRIVEHGPCSTILLDRGKLARCRNRAYSPATTPSEPSEGNPSRWAFHLDGLSPVLRRADRSCRDCSRSGATCLSEPRPNGNAHRRFARCAIEYGPSGRGRADSCIAECRSGSGRKRCRGRAVRP